jgi:hypothetical protein
VLGGLHKRAPSHQWDGRIEAARIVSGILPDEALSPDPAIWSQGLVIWNAKAGLTEKLSWFGSSNDVAEDPRQLAMVDLCHVLLNANEFFYLH